MGSRTRSRSSGLRPSSRRRSSSWGSPPSRGASPQRTRILQGYTRCAMALTDRYGLEVSTASTTALERFQDGMDRLLAYRPGAAESFAAALEADDGLAVAHAGTALIAVV